MNRVGIAAVATITAFTVSGCAGEQRYDPLEEFEELNITTVIDAPGPEPGRYSAIDRDAIDRGEYLVELLGCGVCHTDGAFDGAPDMSRPLAGSQTGIAWESPLGTERPGIVYPPNITPSEDTGIGLWSDKQIADSISAGIGRHGSRRITTMPWQAYAKLSGDDVDAIVTYLKSIKPIEHEVPAAVEPGRKASKPFVYFGVYRTRQ
jgi:mono/diheme cytochrome c family protein